VADIDTAEQDDELRHSSPAHFGELRSWTVCVTSRPTRALTKIPTALQRPVEGLAHPPVAKPLQHRDAALRPGGRPRVASHFASDEMVLRGDDGQSGLTAASPSRFPQLATAGCALERYSARMQRPIVASKLGADLGRYTLLIPSDSNAGPARLRRGAHGLGHQPARRQPGVCHTRAMSVPIR
jgi:hypothetical protein